MGEGEDNQKRDQIGEIGDTWVDSDEYFAQLSPIFQVNKLVSVCQLLMFKCGKIPECY